MKNKKTILALVVLVLFAAAALVCWSVFGPETVEGSKTVTVDVTHKDGTVNTFTLLTDAEYLADAMMEQDLLAGEDSQYGIYVLTVDGETVDESNQEWWGYTKSGETVNFGVDNCAITDGDHYEFEIHVGW